MGVEYQAVIVVGLPTDEVEFDMDFAEDNGLDIIGRYFDAGWDDSIVGIAIATTDSYSWTELKTLELPGDIVKATAEFRSATGLVPRVFLSTWGR